MATDPSSSTTPNIPLQLASEYPLIQAFDWKEFACGCGSAFINIGVTYPIYKAIFRQMLHGVPLSSAVQQLQTEGFTYLYRGMLPPLAQKTISLSIMFGVFDGTRRVLVQDFHVNQYTAKLVAGATSGVAEALLLPFERVQTLLAHSKYHEHFSNTWGSFRYVLSNHGFKELYRGIVPVLWRNGTSNALFFILREEVNALFPERSSASSKAMQEFVAGACIGATISTLFYPLQVIKVSMQRDMGHPSESMWAACKTIYNERERRLLYFYRGCFFNTCRSFISWGIINVAYESLKVIITD